MFLLLCASGDNSGILQDSPYCRSFCYDNNRASVRTCPCKPLLTLSIIAVMRKKKRGKKIQLSRAASRTSASLLLFLFRSVRDAARAVFTAACCRGATHELELELQLQHSNTQNKAFFIFLYAISLLLFNNAK